MSLLRGETTQLFQRGPLCRNIHSMHMFDSVDANASFGYLTLTTTMVPILILYHPRLIAVRNFFRNGQEQLQKTNDFRDFNYDHGLPHAAIDCSNFLTQATKTPVTPTFVSQLVLCPTATSNQARIEPT